MPLFYINSSLTCSCPSAEVVHLQSENSQPPTRPTNCSRPGDQEVLVTSSVLHVVHTNFHRASFIWIKSALMKTWWRNALGCDYVALLYWRQLVSHLGYHSGQTSRKRWEYTGWMYSIIIDSTQVCYCIFVSTYYCGGEFWIQFYRITLCSLFPIFFMSHGNVQRWMEIQSNLFFTLWWVYYHSGEKHTWCGGDGP